jgi:hypothetical protein
MDFTGIFWAIKSSIYFQERRGRKIENLWKFSSYTQRRSVATSFGNAVKKLILYLHTSSILSY